STSVATAVGAIRTPGRWTFVTWRYPAPPSPALTSSTSSTVRGAHRRCSARSVSGSPARPGSSSRLVSSSSITLPAKPGLGYGSRGTTVPVYLRNAGATSVPIGTASLQGFAASDFSLVADGCSGAVLAPGSSCDLFLRFRASQRGPRSAILELPHGSRDAVVQLDALVRPGTTSLTMKASQVTTSGRGRATSSPRRAPASGSSPHRAASSRTSPPATGSGGRSTCTRDPETCWPWATTPKRPVTRSTALATACPSPGTGGAATP